MSLCGDQSNTTLGGNVASSDSTLSDSKIQGTAPGILSLIICTLTVLMGVPGNGAVVWVTGFKMKSNVHTVCFLNLAVADLTYCLILPFLVAAMLVHVWCRHHLLWMFLVFAVALSMCGGIFLLTLISITRCLAVIWPIWFHQHLRLAWVCRACFGAWGLAILTCLPNFLSEQFNLYLVDKTIEVYEVTCVVFTFGLPIAIMAACYLLMCWKLRGNRSAKTRKPVRLIVTVVAAFIVCWLPITVCRLLLACSQPVPAEWIFVTFSLASFNSALNPLLYVFVGRDFRQVFRSSLAALLRLAFAEEGVTSVERRSDIPARNLSRVTSPEDEDGGHSAAPGGSQVGISPRGCPLPSHGGSGAESAPQGVQIIERYSTGTGTSAHPSCADHDANVN